MIHTLRRQIAAPDTLARLRELAADAPESAPVSLRLALGRSATDWLDLLPAHQPHWYRARPDRDEYRLAIGHALQVATAGANRFAALDNAYAGFCRHWRHNGPALAFAGFAFDTAGNAPLPNALLAIPAILLENLDGDCSVTLSAPAGRLAQAVTEWLPMLASAPPGPTPQLLPGRPAPLDDRAWIARVNAALRDIAAGHVAKVVLSRSRQFRGSAAFSPAAILARLIAQQPAGVIYAHGNGQQSFLGATPERLVRLRAGRIDVDALAGTAWPGSLALSESKNRHEQSLVVRAICAALAPLCAVPPQVGSVEQHQAGQLAHWRSRIAAQARPGTRLFDLVRTLHPTPAVGGFPAATAQDWLVAHGEKRSGWYSGGFGLLGPDGDGEFSVALRSALIDGDRAELQAGAGIVAGSDAPHELAETEAKLGTLLAALTAGPLAADQANLSA
jgi:isochorismate synthase